MHIDPGQHRAGVRVTDQFNSALVIMPSSFGLGPGEARRTTNNRAPLSAIEFHRQTSRRRSLFLSLQLVSKGEDRLRPGRRGVRLQPAKPIEPRPPETQLQIRNRSMPDNDINVTNASGDQDHSQSVHRHIASGMVADLVGDCERRRRPDKWARILAPPWVNMK